MGRNKFKGPVGFPSSLYGFASDIERLLRALERFDGCKVECELDNMNKYKVYAALPSCHILWIGIPSLRKFEDLRPTLYWSLPSFCSSFLESPSSGSSAFSVSSSRSG